MMLRCVGVALFRGFLWVDHHTTPPAGSSGLPASFTYYSSDRAPERKATSA